MNELAYGEFQPAAPADASPGLAPAEAAARAADELRSAPDAHQSLARAAQALTEEMPGCTAAVLLDDADGLRVAAASSDSLPALLCVDAACADGPARMSYRTGRAVACHRLPTRRFARFGETATAAGFASAYGLPISRGAGRPPLGALLLLAAQPRALDHTALAALEDLARAMAIALHPTDPAGVAIPAGDAAAVHPAGAPAVAGHEDGAGAGELTGDTGMIDVTDEAIGDEAIGAPAPGSARRLDPDATGQRAPLAGDGASEPDQKDALA